MDDIVKKLRATADDTDAVAYLLEEAAAHIERLSQKCDCPVADNRASGENVGRELAHTAVDTLTDGERAAVERAIETLDMFQTTIGWHSAVDEDAATLWRLLGRMA